MEIQNPSANVVELQPVLEAPRAFPEAGASVRGGDVLVVIPTLNEAKHIETCVRSLMRGDVRMKDADVVVADGGSRDGTQEIVTRLMHEFPRLQLIENPKRLQAAAINLAAAKFGADKSVLVRCDAHSQYPRNYVLDVADSLVNRDAASVVTPMDAEGESCFQRANAYIVDTILGSGGSAHRGGKTSEYVDHGHHAGFSMKRFLEIGGYDESFSHNEDAEYDRRLKDAGGKIFLDANVRVIYRPRATVRALARQYFSYGKGRARNLVKHHDLPKLRQLAPVAALLGCLAGLAIAPFSVWGLILPGGYLAVLAGASVVVPIWKGSLCGVFAGLASATMHMSWAVGFLKQLTVEATRKKAPMPGKAHAE